MAICAVRPGLLKTHASMKNRIPWLILLTVIYLVPQVASAAWWNPFTWEIFSRQTDQQIERNIPEEFDPVAEGGIPVIPADDKDKQSKEIEILNQADKDLKKQVTQPKIKVQSQQPVAVDTWAEQEAQDFAYANARGWTTLISTNSLGEKRYYYLLYGEWSRADSEQQMLELAKAAQVLNGYKVSQENSKQIEADLNIEWLKFKLEHPGYNGNRYSGTYRTDSKGDVFYSDNQGNFITCHTDTWGVTSCGDVQ